MAFKFIRTGTGELSGPSMIYQIEQGFDDTAASVEEVHKTAEKAEATANKALEEATEATSVADVALKTAQDAQASAEAAQNRADEAWNAATGGGESAEAAMQRANAAYELAGTANANALSAQSKADAATTAAEEATTAASTATTAATEATATANEAISKAGTAEFAANQASSDVRMLKSIIDGLENVANEFEADSYTTSLDSFVSALVKKYMTGAITSALPDGVSAPFWFYNWSTSDLAKVFQFIQTNTGSYGRIGTPSGITMRDGEDTFYIQFKSGTSTSATSVAISCADNALTAAGQHGFTWTATSTPARGLVGTLAWDATAPDGTEITIGNRVVATVTGGNVVVSDFSPSPSTNATLALTGGTITTSSTTLEISFVWTSLDASGCTWDAWNALLGGTVTTDGVTIKYNSSNELQAKDVAIGGNASDLASARGIFDTLTKGSVDCNTLTEQGVYAIALSGSVNGPGFSAKLIVFNGKNSKFVNQMALAADAGTSGAIRVAYRSKNNEDVWSSWSEGILSGRIGDGLTVSNGIISVPEMQGVTASTDGTSGLVPPAAAGQANYVLCGAGEWRDIATLVAGDFVPDSRQVIAGTGLTGGGPLSSDVTLAVKLTNSVSLTDSTTAASATAVKSAYARGTAGVTAAGEAKTTAENALTAAGEAKTTAENAATAAGEAKTTAENAATAAGEAKTTAKNALTVANSKQPNLGFTPVQQGGGSGQDNSKIYIGHGTNGLKAQIGTTDLGNIVTTKGGAVKASQAALADRAQVANTSETLFVTGWGNTKWGSTPYGRSPLYVWCLPTGGADMEPCSPSVLSAGAANWCTYTPNVRVGRDGSVLPAGGTWRTMTSRNGEGAIMDLAGGSTVNTPGGVFMAIRVA